VFVGGRGNTKEPGSPTEERRSLLLSRTALLKKAILLPDLRGVGHYSDARRRRLARRVLAMAAAVPGKRSPARHSRGFR